ncbi:hypothetical protein ACH4VM_19265 [Streptomyces sp. NPDC020792]|uniref:hypothetical protein n=1 Tax=Streptomyces sp. NPDC020792 TaxID=3365089 RepID=UPI0037AFD720
MAGVSCVDGTDPKNMVRRGYDVVSLCCFVATVGHGEWTGTEENWLGGGAPMWWSHADAATNRAWITQAGLVVENEEFIGCGVRSADRTPQPLTFRPLR